MAVLGLRCYGVYKFDRYPEWTILVYGFGENSLGEWLEGYAFDDNGIFVTAVSIALPMDYIEIGYIYTPLKGYKLTLEKIEE